MNWELIQSNKKNLINLFLIVILTFISFYWTFWIFHKEFDLNVVLFVLFIRLVCSRLIFNDYSTMINFATEKSFLIKSFVHLSAFVIYMPILYSTYRISFFLSELFFFLFTLNFIVLFYSYFKSRKIKNKTAVIFGAGEAGLTIYKDIQNQGYKLKYFIDDSLRFKNRSIEGIEIISSENFKTKFQKNKVDLFILAIPSIDKIKVKTILKDMKNFSKEIKYLPPVKELYLDKPLDAQLKDISIEDLLARDPKDLDKKQIERFTKDKKILITGAGGSIGSEISRQCLKFGARQVILVDNSEFNLYKISEELKFGNIVSVLQSVQNLKDLEQTFQTYNPDIVIHAAAYKHVPLVEDNITEAIENNVLGTKNTIDLAIKYNVNKFLLISTDKAVRPTNVMGATKRICELYVQNVVSKNTEIVAVRFGNVLGSSGSVIPKFKEQIRNNESLTVTHPDITRYFMLIPEACELVLQAASIGKGGEIFILDMGEPIKIVDLARRMIELSGKDIDIKFTGLRPGEKLYEELLINDTDQVTEYDSIKVAGKTNYDINCLQNDINDLVNTSDKLEQIKKIVKEFNHNKGSH